MDSIKVISGQSLVLLSYFRSRSEGSSYGMFCTHNHTRLFKTFSVANFEFKQRSDGESREVDKPNTIV